MGQPLLDKDGPLRQSKEGDETRTLARARTLTVLRRLKRERKARVVQFLYEAGLIAKCRPMVDLAGADLSEAYLLMADLSQADLIKANLSEAYLNPANLSEANLIGADLSGAEGITNGELSRQTRFLEGATMPDGKKYEDWLKDREGRKDEG